MDNEHDSTYTFEPHPEGAGQAEEPLRKLASYAFMREEHEREVRLHFRSVPANGVAAALRAAGATLITLTGERVKQPGEASAMTDAEGPAEAAERGARKRRKSKARAVPSGEIIIHYFYSLGGIIYTVSITEPSGLVASIANIYPVAANSERELQQRLGLVFTRAAQ